jgi:hypothetical protein
MKKEDLFCLPCFFALSLARVRKPTTISRDARSASSYACADVATISTGTHGD